MAKTFPVTPYELGPGDQGYDQGARIRLDEVDADARWFFKTYDAAKQFMERNGMHHMDEDEMLQLREALKQAQQAPEEDQQ